MDVTQIPFVKHIGIERKEEGTLKLEPNQTVQNHIQTIHASAQFTLAETQSGLYLLTLFPEYVGEVIPLLRSSSVKYKSPATSALVAHVTVCDEVKGRFISYFERKGKGSIVVNIELKDEEGNIAMIDEFNWFVKRINND